MAAKRKAPSKPKTTKTKTSKTKAAAKSKAPAKKKATPKKKPAAKTTNTKKAAAKKTVAKKADVKKADTKKAGAKKAATKKAVAKKTVAKKKAAAKPKATKTKSSPAKAKPAGKKATPQKTAIKKTAPKKTTAKKPAVKKSAAKKTAAAKKAVKKAPVKKPASKKVDAKTTRKAKAENQVSKSSDTTVAAKKAPRPRSVSTEPTFTPYRAGRDEGYMNEDQKAHFRDILRQWKYQLMEEVDRTVHHMQDEATNYPDPADRASQEEEFSLELKTRDRERKLIRKIDSTLELIDQDDYGYCESCGIEIGVQRLEARPTANQCIDCKTLDEIKERQLHG